MGTNEQIEKLRAAAAAAGNHEQVRLCDLALGHAEQNQEDTESIESLRERVLRVAEGRLYRGYVRSTNGCVYVQLPRDNRWGFVLASDDQEYPGGFDCGAWEAIPESEASAEDRERLGWLLGKGDAP